MLSIVGLIQRREVWFRLLVVLGVLLRIRAWLAGRSLWMDEASFAQRLQEPLTGPSYVPLGFKLTAYGIVQVLGNNEYTLRLLPLLFSCLALVLFAAWARRLLAPDAALLAVGLFAIHGPLVYYAAEFKQ